MSVSLFFVFRKKEEKKGEMGRGGERRDEQTAGGRERGKRASEAHLRIPSSHIHAQERPCKIIVLERR